MFIKKLLFAIYSAVTIVSLLVGFYMALSNFNKDWTMFYVFLGIFIFGFILLSLSAIYIMVKRNPRKQKSENKEK